jgi:uncharacterized protein YllA (UPF0747 family)
MPRSPDDWRAQVDRVRGAAPVRWLETIGPAIAPTGAARERLERAAATGGVVVTTGQQAALFGGPLYTLCKALSALALADALELRTGVPTAPVFWAATDDADFVEAATTYAADGRGLHTLALSGRPADGTMMAALTLRGVEPLVEALRGASGSMAHARYFELARDAFRDGTSLGDAYVGMLRALLEPLGIAVMDSSHDAYREAARPVMDVALGRADHIAREVADASAAIRRAGFEPQVEDDRGLSLVFTVQHGVKRRLTIAEAASARGSSLQLAPNVLLRPVVERSLFPTVAYVAGPGELAYFAQSNAVARSLDMPDVVGSPRWSCTVIETFAARALGRLGVEYTALKNPHAIEARFARQTLPEDVAAAVDRLRGGLDSAVRDLRQAVARSSLVPDAVVEGLERSLGSRLTRAERRLLAAAKRRNDQVRRDLGVACAAIYPKGVRQERLLNFVPMLARGGDGLLAQMRGAALEHAEARVGQHAPASATVR